MSNVVYQSSPKMTTARRRPQLPLSPEDINEMFYQGYEPGEPINDPEPMTSTFANRPLVNALPPAPFGIILDAETIKSVRGLCPAEKAERIGEYIGWTGGSEYLDGRGMPVFCARSPITGRVHTVSYNARKGMYTCSCEGCTKHSNCYHMESWCLYEYASIAEPFLQARANEAAARRSVESNERNAAFAAMPTEERVATVQRMIARDFE